MSNERPKFAFLFVEDEMDEQKRYVNAVKSAMEGSIQFDILKTRSRLEAEEILEKRLVPFNSVDQRIPLNPDGRPEDAVDENGVAVAKRIQSLQPFHSSCLITSFPQWKELKAAGYGVDYCDKTSYPPPIYGAHFRRRLDAFMSTGVWESAAIKLPSLLASHCNKIGDPNCTPTERLENVRRFWETCIRLTTYVMLKIFESLEYDRGEAVKSLASGLKGDGIDNAAFVRTLQKHLPVMCQLLEEKRFRIHAREVRRFFDGRFHAASSELLKMRNQISHESTVEQAETILGERRDDSVSFLLGAGFWATHPLCVDSQLYPIGNSIGLRVRPLHGLFKRFAQLGYSKATNFIQENSQGVIQCVVDPLKDENEGALLIDLHPLVRALPTKERVDRLVIAYHPRKNLYLDPLDKHRTYAAFGDDELPRWWRSNAGKD